jgi:hypothetical protein
MQDISTTCRQTSSLSHRRQLFTITNALQPDIATSRSRHSSLTLFRAAVYSHFEALPRLSTPSAAHEARI